MKKITLIISSCVLLFACSEKKAEQQKTETTETKQIQNQPLQPHQPFFRLKEYMEKQIAFLDSLKPEVQKTITMDEKKEIKTFANLDFRKELQVFIDADLNKPAWKDSYEQATSSEDNITSVIYTAKDSSLPVQRMIVEYRHGEIEDIAIMNKISNSLYSTTQSLIYKPNAGYTIVGSQDITFNKEHSYSVEAVFKKK